MGFSFRFQNMIKAFVILSVLCVRTVNAGVFSEIDILVREAAVAQVSPMYSWSDLDQAFYDITYDVSDEEIEGCNFVIEGLMPVLSQTYKFTACVVARSKMDIIVSVIRFN